MKGLFIDLLAFGAILSSVLVITSKNPVIAVIFLISLFINAAGYLIFSGVGFIGLTYIILYVGAITVLFLFVIMMINIKLTDILETGKSYTQNLPLGLSVGLLFIYEFASMTVQLPSQSLLHISEYFSSSFPLYIITYFNTLGSGPQMLPHLDTHHMLQNNNTIVETAFNPNIFDQSIINFTQIQAIGQGLYTYGAFWLILCSIILLLAMVSPIFISKK
jgi:NADH-ubiquinone oxidoreductase chain 6